jgi:hypothetical protein
VHRGTGSPVYHPPVFGVPAAAVVFSAAVAAHLLFSHLVSVRRKERALIGFMALSVPAYFLLHLVASVPGAMEDVVAGLCALGFLVLGYAELWSLVERSFSLRIVIDVDESGAQGATRVDLARRYGEGRGLEWMMSKRLAGLVDSGMLEPQDGSYRLTRRGSVVARTLRRLRWLLGPRDRQLLD